MITAGIFAILIALYQNAFFYQVIDVAECGGWEVLQIWTLFAVVSFPSNPSRCLLTSLT